MQSYIVSSFSLNPLSLAKECYSMKLDLLTNATVVDDAIRFVSSSDKSKEKQQLKSSKSNSNEDDKESKEPAYNKDEKSDKIGEEKQEEKNGEITITTTNQVF